MGWFWGTSNNGNGQSTTTDDPLRNLDPSLREFLEKESPVKYTTTESTTPHHSPPPPPAKKPQSYTEQIFPTSEPSSPASSETTNSSSTPKVPAASLFPDGRYAHLWKTYTPLFEVENANKSDQEKLLDVLEGYKYRKSEIGRAALENCANEQWLVSDCFRNGGFKSRMTMCRAENKGLERCYMMQAKFLKALGYLSTFDRPPEVDEQIQMHADTLYHRMLEQEKAIQGAKAAGLPVPQFPPIVPSMSTAAPPTAAYTRAADTLPEEDRITLDKLRPSIQTKLKKRLKGLNPDQKEIEEKAINAEIEAGDKLARDITTLFDQQARSRKERREQGTDTFGDKFSGLFGW